MVQYQYKTVGWIIGVHQLNSILKTTKLELYFCMKSFQPRSNRPVARTVHGFAGFFP